MLDELNNLGLSCVFFEIICSILLGEISIDRLKEDNAAIAPKEVIEKHKKLFKNVIHKYNPLCFMNCQFSPLF